MMREIPGDPGEGDAQGLPNNHRQGNVTRPLTPAEKTLRAGELVGRAIEPFLASNAPEIGQLDTWLVAFEAKDKADGRAPAQRDMADVRVRLQVFTRFWQNFRYSSRPNQTRWANEILGTLNKAVHVPASLASLEYVTFLGIARSLLGSLAVDQEILSQIEGLAREAMYDELHGKDAPPSGLAERAHHANSKPINSAYTTSDLSLIHI